MYFAIHLHSRGGKDLQSIETNWEGVAGGLADPRASILPVISCESSEKNESAQISDALRLQLSTPSPSPSPPPQTIPNDEKEGSPMGGDKRSNQVESIAERVVRRRSNPHGRLHPANRLKSDAAEGTGRASRMLRPLVSYTFNADRTTDRNPPPLSHSPTLCWSHSCRSLTSLVAASRAVCSACK